MPRIGQMTNTLQPFWQTGDGKACCLYHGDMRNVLPLLPAESFDSVVTDPPYELDFMGKHWDSTGIAFQPETWSHVLRTVKPGGYMLAFGGTRTYHRMVCAIEDAGWEIRDCLMWMYGTGFPKGQGCLKPAYEPIVLARKPGKKVLALGIDECRVGAESLTYRSRGMKNLCDQHLIHDRPYVAGVPCRDEPEKTVEGRYPANVLHDGSDEVMEEFEKFGESKPKSSRTGRRGGCNPAFMSKEKGDNEHQETNGFWPEDQGGTVARFFYTAKATKEERGEAREHPTVKPLELMKWCVRLVTPEGGRVLDCFAGSSMTGVACMAESRTCVLVEKELPYAEAGKRKLEKVSKLLLPQKRVNVLDNKS